MSSSIEYVVGGVAVERFGACKKCFGVVNREFAC